MGPRSTMPASPSDGGLNPSPDTLLGPKHPLVRALERQQIAVERAVVVGALLTAGLLGLSAGIRAALPLVVAAAAVELVLVCAVATLAASKRACVLELISTGGGDLPIPAVERACARLLSSDARLRMARDLELLRAGASQWSPVFPAQRMTFNPRVIRAVAPELAELAALIQDDHAGLAGVALLEQSLTDGSSPVYGDDAELLRQHLRRIRFLLA